MVASGSWKGLEETVGEGKDRKTIIFANWRKEGPSYVLAE